MNTYKIAPTDLTFLLKDCPKCFHHKVVHNSQRFYSPMPSVFNKIDKIMTGAYDGKEIVFNSEIFNLNTKSKTLKSAPVEVGEGVEIFISGRHDCLGFSATSNMVLDFKTSALKDQYRDLYWRQLMAYALAFENPAKGDPLKISEVCLLPVVPESLDPDTGAFKFSASVVDLHYDTDRFLHYLSTEIYPLLKKEPEGKFNCPHCLLRDIGFDPKLKQN